MNSTQRYEEQMNNSSLSSVKVFESSEFGKVRMVVIKDEPWFVGKDVAVILGYANTRQAIQVNVDEDDINLIQLSDLQDSLSDRLPDHMKGSKITIINESGLYSLILRSEKPEAKRFKKWVTSEVLPSIRKTGSYSTGSRTSISPDRYAPSEFMRSLAVGMECLKNTLRISDASLASYYNKGVRVIGLPELDYVVSKGVKFSASSLLAKLGRPESINLFNAKMEEMGYLETKERKSTSSKTGFKRFKCLTGKGLEFGENMVSPKNEKETQPHYYENKFPELLKILFG